MKSHPGFACVCVCAAVALLSISAPSAPPAKDGKKSDAKPVASIPDAPIPLASFVIPATPKDGKDPFFPKSTRPFVSQQPPVPKGQKPPVIEINLTLTGIIPPKFAMVNGRTFAEGEEGDVVVNGVRKRIRCLKVKDESAVIELLPEGERRELKLRLGA